MAPQLAHQPDLPDALPPLDPLPQLDALPPLDALTVGGAMTSRVQAAAQRRFAGQSRGVPGMLPFLGPAVVASVAYVDPGNFATNIQGGAQFGYLLLWVVLLANLVAMLFQSLSARLGIVTGRNLAQLCRQHLPRPLVLAMWVASEIAAMATDLAEFVGAAIGLSLLLHIPMLPAMALTGIATFAMLALQRRGFRPLELAIGALVGVIGLSYLVEMLIAPIDWGTAGFHAVVPQLAGPESITLAVGIFGATVMPHAIFLHSSLTQDRIRARDDRERRIVLRMSNIEVMAALGVAGLVNMAMLSMAAAAFHDGVHNGVAELGEAYHTLVPLLGGAASVVFLTSLLASGLSSSTVGTMAGQVVMQGFVGWAIPLWLRRTVTMLPAFVVVALGMDTTRALVLSQVVLSLALPVPMIALLFFSFRRDLMGAFRPGRLLAATAVAATVLTLAMNVVLLAQAAG